MISREVYLEFAKKNQIPMILLFEYYNEFNQKKELEFSSESFEEIFTQFLQQNSVTLQKVREYFDIKYGIVTIYDKQGNFITII